MYAQIGDIILSGQLGFETFNYVKASSIAKHALIDGKPRLQKTGDELDTLSFSILLHKGFCIPEDVIFNFENYVINATPVKITLGTGELLGTFILTEAKKEIIQTNPNGGFVEVKLEVSAIEFFLETVVNTGTAIAENSPIQITAPQTSTPVNAQVALDIRECSNLSAEIDNNLKKSDINPSVRDSKLKDTINKIGQIDKKLTGVYISVSNALILVNEAANLKQRITATKRLAKNLKSFCEIRDISSANAANSDFQASMRNTSNLTAPFTKNYALRRSTF